MSESSTPGSQLSRAQQACMACRNLKRKCDKLLPACGLCSRTGRACDYSSVAPSAANTFQALQTRLAELEGRLSPRAIGSSTAVVSPADQIWSSPTSSGPHGTGSGSSITRANISSLRFLDVDRFRDSRLRLPAPATVPIPAVRGCPYRRFLPRYLTYLTSY